MSIHRKSRIDYSARENADRENIHDKTDTTNQTNCRDEFTPILVRSKKHCTSSTTHKMDT